MALCVVRMLCSLLLAKLVALSCVGAVPLPHSKSFPIATLSNGRSLPLVGLGCSSELKKSAVASALTAGYRHLDTAQAYQWGYAEDEVGDAVAESGVPRGNISVQTKIHPEDLGYEATKKAFLVSLERLRSPYVDSMLIHKPRCWEGACDKEPDGTWQDSWRALEEFYESGKAHAIGICDVDKQLLDELLVQKHKPHIIQNWMDPFHQDKIIRSRCKKEGIQYQAYSTLGAQWVHFRKHKRNPVLTHPMLNAVAKAHDATVAQVVINWATRHGVAVIPASRNIDRQQSNLDSFEFDLSDAEMAAIDALDGEISDDDTNADEVDVSFENKGDVPLQVFWVSQSGEEVLVGDIAPGSQLPQRTFHSHKFQFVRNGQIIGKHVVSRDGGPRQSHAVGQQEL